MLRSLSLLGGIANPLPPDSSWDVTVRGTGAAKVLMRLMFV